MKARHHVAVVRALFPVVAGGKIALLLVAEIALVFVVVAITLGTGGSASSALKACVINPAMLVVVVGSAHVVSTLRTTGELELAVTLASPARFVLHRMAPVVTVAVAQGVVAGLALMLVLAPWQVLLGWVLGLSPLALAVAASTYWNLRLRGTGSVVMASLATVVAAMVWIDSSEMFLESENMIYMTLLEVVASALRCQLGLVVATLSLAALARRRLGRTEELLND